jgi:hypothetical protein
MSPCPTPTNSRPCDLADAGAFALRFESGRPVHHTDEYMAAIAAERVVTSGVHILQ